MGDSSMKRALFQRPGLFIERCVNREGPEITFNVWKPNTARCFQESERKAMLRFIAWPKSTPTGVEIREWLDSFNQPALEIQQQPIDTTQSWDPKAHPDDDDPTAKTKMVV